jgi:hypothetical protein
MYFLQSLWPTFQVIACTPFRGAAPICCAWLNGAHVPKTLSWHDANMERDGVRTGSTAYANRGKFFPRESNGEKWPHPSTLTP